MDNDLVPQGDIGLDVAQMIVELVRDNRKIVDRITRLQIDEFVDLLRGNKVFNNHHVQCIPCMQLSLIIRDIFIRNYIFIFALLSHVFLELLRRK